MLEVIATEQDDALQNFRLFMFITGYQIAKIQPCVAEMPPQTPKIVMRKGTTCNWLSLLRKRHGYRYLENVSDFDHLHVMSPKVSVDLTLDHREICKVDSWCFSGRHETSVPSLNGRSFKRSKLCRTIHRERKTHSWTSFRDKAMPCIGHDFSPATSDGSMRLDCQSEASLTFLQI